MNECLVVLSTLFQLLVCLRRDKMESFDRHGCRPYGHAPADPSSVVVASTSLSSFAVEDEELDQRSFLSPF